MGAIGWDTPPTEEEIGTVVDWNTPPTELEMGTVDSTAQPSAGAQVLDYLTTPKDVTSEAFKEGQASVSTTGVLPAPTQPPEMEQSMVSWFTNKNYDVEQVNEFMTYHTSQGMRKNEALDLLKEQGGMPLDLSNASRFDMSTKAPSEAVSDITSKSIVRGLERTGLGVAQASVDIADLLGVDTTEEQGKLDFSRGKMTEEQSQMEATYGMQSPIEIGVKYTPELLSMGINPTSFVKTAGFEFSLEYALSRGEGFSEGQSLTRASIIGLITGSAVKVFGETSKLADGLTPEAHTGAKYMNISTEEARTLVKGVPLEDQAKILAEQGGSDTAGPMYKALTNTDDATRRQYAKQLAMRRQEVAESIGMDDFEGIREATKKEFSTMRQAVRDMSLNHTYSLERVSKQLDDFLPYARNDAAVTKVQRFTEQIKNKPSQSLDEILELRQEINYEWSKTDSYQAKKMLETIKTDLDGFLKHSEVDPKLHNMIETSIKSYSRMKNQEELINLIDGHTATKAKGSKYGERKAVDWGQLAETVKKEGIGKDVEKTTELIGRMASKYSDETDLLRMTASKGELVAPPTLSSSPTGMLEVKAVRTFGTWLWEHMPTAAGEKLAFQNAIAKSMRNAKTQREFAENLYKNKNTSLIIKARIKTMLENVDLVSKQDAVKAIDLKVEAKKLKLESAQLTKEINANMKTKLTDEPLKQRYNEIKADLAKETTPEKIDSLKAIRDEVTNLKSKDPASDLSETQKIARDRAERTALSDKAKQQSTQNTRVSKEINTMFKTRQVESDSRLLYNRIQENIVKASNKGDEEAVQTVLNDLSVFREYMTDMPKRLDSDELKTLQRKLARKEAVRLTREGITDPAERSVRIRTIQDSAETASVTDRLNSTARENIARNTETAVETVAVTRQARFTTASNNVVENLNASTGKTWTVGSNTTHPRFTSEDGEYFTLHIYGNNIGATTTGLRNGSGTGSKVYPAIWDMSRDLGGVYKPDSTLLTANPVRMGINMLNYADSLGGKDIPWIRIGRSQAGIRGRDLANKTLTRGNQKSLALGLRSFVESKLPKGFKLNTLTTPEQLEAWGNKLGRNTEIRLGQSSLTKLRNWLYSSKPGLTLGTGVLAVMLEDEELMRFLDEIE